jgi:hypothetical protein
MRITTTLIPLLVYVGAFGMAAPAVAGEPDELIARGLELRRQGKDQDALPLFEHALEQGQSGKTLAQLGLCEQALGLWLRAETHLQEAVTRPTDPWIKKNLGALNNALDLVRSRLGVIDIWGTPNGARVDIDGGTVGTLPLARPVHVPEGRRVVTVEANGFVTEKRTLEIVPGATVREHVALVAANLARAAADTDGSKSPHAPMALPAPSATPAPWTGPALPPPGANLHQDATGSWAEPSSDGLLHRWWFWAVVAGVAVAGGVSAYFVFRGGEKCQVAPGGVCGTF